jgi:hypothetical protein
MYQEVMTETAFMAMRTSAYAFAALLALASCARNQVAPPKDQLADATRAMERAAQVNAYDFAAFDMAAADRKLVRARDLARSDEDDDRREAARLAEQVTADAHLAEAKARLAGARSINAEAKETLDALRREAEQNEGGAP